MNNYPKAFIFDFDGTLVDSEKFLRNCFMNVINSLAPERAEYAKNILIGPPLVNTASEILGQKNQNLIDKFKKLFIKMHDDQFINNIQPYSHVNRVLKKMYAKNIPMAIATNKRLIPTKRLINHLGWGHYFFSIECSNGQSKIRGKSEMIKDIIKQHSLFKSSYFVGDTVNDGLSANLNQLKFIKACYGYGTNQDWSEVITYQSIKKFSEILKLI